MQFGGHDISFWLAVLGATILKIATSPRMSKWRVVISGLAALFVAWVFTKPALAFLELDPDTYTIPVAVLIALTGEGICKWLIYAANNPKEAIEFLKVWRTR